MSEQKINIKIISKQYEISGRLIENLFDYVYGGDGDYDGTEDVDGADGSDEIGGGDDGDDTDDGYDFSRSGMGDSDGTIELFTEGVLTAETDARGVTRVEIAYDESELTGMPGARTCVSFDADDRRLISMVRGGSVYTALVFEPGRRNICAYHTEHMAFELCVFTRGVKNLINAEALTGGIYLDYSIEIRGATAERNIFSLEIFPAEK